jgi:hypothetical protein
MTMAGLVKVKQCGLCAMEFEEHNLPGVVSFQAIANLRSKWGSGLPASAAKLRSASARCAALRPLIDWAGAHPLFASRHLISRRVLLPLLHLLLPPPSSFLLPPPSSSSSSPPAHDARKIHRPGTRLSSYVPFATSSSTTMTTELDKRRGWAAFYSGLSEGRGWQLPCT